VVPLCHSRYLTADAGALLVGRRWMLQSNSPEVVEALAVVDAAAPADLDDGKSQSMASQPLQLPGHLSVKDQFEHWKVQAQVDVGSMAFL
jgi:hypothetical protein